MAFIIYVLPRPEQPLSAVCNVQLLHSITQQIKAGIVMWFLNYDSSDFFTDELWS